MFKYKFQLQKKYLISISLSLMKAASMDLLPFQAFYKFTGRLEEVAQTFGHRVFSPWRRSFALFCVDKKNKKWNNNN